MAPGKVRDKGEKKVGEGQDGGPAGGLQPLRKGPQLPHWRHRICSEQIRPAAWSL